MNKYFRFVPFILGVLPTLSLAQIDTIQLSPKSTLKPIGYLRTTIGESLGGKTMTQFTAPGAGSTYRLGNEPDTFAEFGAAYNYQLNDANNTSFDVVVQFTGYTPFDSGESFKLDNLGQFYAKMNNVFGDADLWAGKRFFNRSDFHILNYVWYNVAQESNVGIGIEDINVFNKKGKLALTLLEFENKKVNSLNPLEEDEARKGNLKSYIFDARLTSLKTNTDGTLNFWGRVATRKANKEIGYEGTNGFGVGAWHQQNNLLNGNASNHFQTSFRKGITVNQYQYSGVPVYEIYGDPAMRNFDMKKNYAFEVSDNFYYEAEKNFAVNALVMYRLDNRGVEPYNMLTGEKVSVGKNINWFTAGFRYIKYIHKHFNLALEVGTDYIDNQTINRHGWMQKVTFAPQFSWDYGFYSRPVIRPFVTFANWSESLKGTVGNYPGQAPFADKTNGLTYGVSFEIWW